MTTQTSTTNSSSPSHQIGVLNEKPLHAALKAWYAGENDQVEVKVDDKAIDIVQGDLLVEIQTRNFSGMKRKLINTRFGSQNGLLLARNGPNCGGGKTGSLHLI